MTDEPIILVVSPVLSDGPRMRGQVFEGRVDGRVVACSTQPFLDAAGAARS